MDDVIAQFAADDTITYYTSDSVMQTRIAKQMTEFSDRVGFMVEPGETVIIPVKPFNTSNTAIVNAKGSVETGMTIVYPQMADDNEVTELAMKNTSRTRVVIHTGNKLAMAYHLPKQTTRSTTSK